ncbi:uncharacterized protein LOC110809367 [Carica papaya]|uniref:uncharacterized protein LOC110809367 n=1 Tax=Carica papaya TaxID=3649 RepID=UPI000B8CAAE7|nr:uncharacterized protein LOC110809367 [Carica papaya]
MWWLESSCTSTQSNLERFLCSITPSPPSFSLPQSCIHGLNSLWQPGEKDVIEYFMLSDLWNCYDEWSAYGLGTQVELSNGENVAQYYVPYLSAIQIYTYKSSVSSRNLRDDNNVPEFESDSWSDDSGSDKLSRSLSNNSSKAWDVTSEDSSFDQEASWTLKDRLGYLFFQYFEMSSPYWRVPLRAKVTELARNHPALMTFRSIDLSAASWMAVAWYPIYHIPSQKNEKDLSACFLSYHTLSSCFQDNVIEQGINAEKDMGSETLGSNINGKRKEQSSSSLPPFGLATYKMQGDIWVKPETSDHERLIYLQSAADSWLKQLDIHHHDYNFFSSHSTV